MSKLVVSLVIISMSIAQASVGNAGQVISQEELDRSQRGQTFRYVKKSLITEAFKKTVIFQACTAVVETDNFQKDLHCDPIGDSRGYSLKDLNRRDVILNIYGLAEKAGMTIALVATGFVATTIFSIGMVGAAADISLLLGTVATGGSTIANFIWDWTPTGSLKKARTISKNENFYELDAVIDGSIENYIAYLRDALSNVKPAS